MAEKSVKQLDERHVHWTAEVGSRIREWDAEIVEQIPDERIAWRSLAGTPNEGEVRFHPLSGLDEPPLTRLTRGPADDLRRPAPSWS